MNSYNNFDTIGLIISLIISDSFSASINSLSATCKLPVPQMRKYILTIFSNRILLTHLSPTPEISDEDEDPLKTAKLFLEQIGKGHADDSPIYLIDMDDFIDGYHLVPITSIENGYVSNVYPGLIKNQRTSLFEIKDAIDSISKNILEKQDKIQEAISQRKKIEFDYKSPKFASCKVICSPVSIIQNLTTHMLYIKDTNNYCYRIDRITSKIKKLSDPSDISQYKENPYQKYFWGAEYNSPDAPVHVKLRISTDTSNIIEKIKNDTFLRKTCKLYQDGDFLYYEDDILGMQDFRRWLRSYGSSITVLEPQSLIENIIEGAKLTLSYYDIIKKQ